MLFRSALPAVLLVASVAQATTLLRLDLPALTRTSATVVRGTVKSSQARWTRDRSRIVTETIVTVRDTWKGERLAEVSVLQQGGVVGEVGQLVHGTVTFKPGEEVALFLEARGPGFLITGMMQGVFRIEGDVATQALEDDAHLLDPATQRPETPQRLVLRVDALAAKVVGAAHAETPAPTGAGLRNRR